MILSMIVIVYVSMKFNMFFQVENEVTKAKAIGEEMWNKD